MAGKLCNGVYTQTADPLISRAFCEGMQYRTEDSGGGNRPITDCPHVAADTESYASWRAGWTVANDNAGSALTEAQASCCALVGITAAVIA